MKIFWHFLCVRRGRKQRWKIFFTIIFKIVPKHHVRIVVVDRGKKRSRTSGILLQAEYRRSEYHLSSGIYYKRSNGGNNHLCFCLQRIYFRRSNPSDPDFKVKPFPVLSDLRKTASILPAVFLSLSLKNGMLSYETFCIKNLHSGYCADLPQIIFA